MKTVRYIAVFTMLLFAQNAPAQSVPDYLLLQDISDYKHKTQGKDFITGQPRNIPGYVTRTAPGFLAGVDHYDVDHDDKTYETKYVNRTLGIGVEVTQHAGVDSDRWLLHELDKGFRTSLGIPGDSYGPRQIDGQTVLEFGGGGREYRWLSGNKVVRIQYTDLQMEKTEPIEVVRAYLVKHPSTLSAITLRQLRSTENKTAWIKDEMDRRLWLCDKWFMQLQLGKVQESQVLQESVKSMNIFLDYRERYYGMAAASEKNLLAGYLNTNNGTGIRAKLAEYKTWWQANKNAAISL
jgi:hypothetical protein